MRAKSNIGMKLFWAVIGSIIGFFIAWLFWVQSANADVVEKNVCICHNWEHNPTTVCSDINSILEGHGRHLAKGFDKRGRCPEPTPTETPEPTPPYVEVCEACGGGLTFYNPTDWLFVFDVRVDDEPSLHGSVAPGVTIHEGPLAGQEFGDRWRLVVVDGRIGQHEAYLAWSDLWNEDTGLHKVEYRLAEGAEQNMYFDWVTVSEIPSDCEPNEEPTPTPVPQPRENPITEAGAPICTNTAPVLKPANPLVWRKAGCAIVQWQPTEGDKANVYYHQVQDQTNAHAVRDIDNDGYVEICELGNIDWSFGIQQSNGCAGGETIWIEDGSTNGWTLFTP